MATGKKTSLLASLDMMSPYFLRPLETLFWCPAECQNQSRGPSFLRSHRDFLINYNHQQLFSPLFFAIYTTVQQLLEAEEELFCPVPSFFFFSPSFSHWEKAFTTIIQRWPSHLGFGQA